MGDTKGLSHIKEPDPWSQVPLTFDPSVPGDKTELKTLSKGHKEIGEKLDEDIVRKRIPSIYREKMVDLSKLTRKVEQRRSLIKGNFKKLARAIIVLLRRVCNKFFTHDSSSLYLNG